MKEVIYKGIHIVGFCLYQVQGQAKNSMFTTVQGNNSRQSKITGKDGHFNKNNSSHLCT